MYLTMALLIFHTQTQTILETIKLLQFLIQIYEQLIQIKIDIIFNDEIIIDLIELME
jgi:hypothetical protein